MPLLTPVAKDKPEKMAQEARETRHQPGITVLTTARFGSTAR